MYGDSDYITEMTNSVDKFTNVLNKFTGRNEKYGTMDEFMNDLCCVWSQLTIDERDTVSTILMGKKLNNNRVDDLLRDINNGFKSSTVKEDKEDKENIEKLVSVTEDMLKQKAVDEINNKKEPTILLSAKVGKVILTCKQCGYDMTNNLSEEYRAKSGFDGKRYLDKTPTIHKDLVSDVSCDKCGCNLVDAAISIEVDNPLTQK